MIRRCVLLSLIIVACRPAATPAAGDDASAMTIAQALSRHTDSLMAIPGVVGVGEGELDGRPAIQIMVAELTSNLRRRLPPELDGHPVQVIETGVIRARSDSSPR